MDISINQITPRREGGEITSVTVHFTARTADGLINLNGHPSILTEELNNSIDFEGIEDALKQIIAERVINGEPIIEEGDAE